MTVSSPPAGIRGATGGRTAAKRRPAKGSQGREAVTAALFLAPFLVVYAIFLLAPVFQAVFMSGYDWDLLSPVREFIGFDNYTRMFSDETFWTAFRNTLVFTVVSTPLLIIVGLGLALLLNTKGRGRAVYRAAFFLPYVLPISAVTLIWSYLLNPDRGLIAGFLGWFGLDGIPFLSDPSLAMPSIIVTTVWWSVGFNMVLFLAGLQDIEPAYYEAASLDGAGWWQRFRHITVPGLSHVTILVTVTQFIASFQIFGQVYIMTRGGPGTSTIVLIQQIYEAGFKDYQLGYAAAISVFLFVIMAAVAAIQFRVMGKNS